MTAKNTSNRIITKPWSGDGVVGATGDGLTTWRVEGDALRMSFAPQDWSDFRTIRLQIRSHRRTGARIRLEVIGLLSGGMLVHERDVEDAEVPGYTVFAVDWVGEQETALWLERLEPEPEPRRFAAVIGVRLRCIEPGLWPTVLEVGAPELDTAVPTWDVGGGDLVIEGGWHYACAKSDEWRVVSAEANGRPVEPIYSAPQPMEVINRRTGDSGGEKRSSTTETGRPAEETSVEPAPWLKFGYRQLEDRGSITVERRFDLDLTGYRQMLAKLVWDRDSLLDVVAVVDDGREIPLVEAGRAGELFRAVGASLEGACRLDAVRIRLAETEEREVTGRVVSIDLFWILLRRADAPLRSYRTVGVRRCGAWDRNGEDVPVLDVEVPVFEFDDSPDSATPIGNPAVEGLPFGFHVRRKDLPALRRRFTSGALGRAGERVLREADAAVASELVDRNTYGEPCRWGGVGQPKGARGAGMRLFAPITGFAHLLTGNPKYAFAARRWILRAAASDCWVAEHGGMIDRPEIGDETFYADIFTGTHPRGFAGYMNYPFFVADAAFGVVSAYEMLYHCFSPEERERVETAFADLGTYILYDKLRHAREFYVQMNQGILFALPLLMQTAFLKERDPVYEKMHRFSLEFVEEFGRRPWSEEGVCGEGPGYGSGTLTEYIEALPIIAACRGVEVMDATPEVLPRVFDALAMERSTWRTPGRWPHFIGWSDGGEYNWLGDEACAFFAGRYGDPKARWFFSENRGELPASITALAMPLPEGTDEIPPYPAARVYRDQPQAFFRTGIDEGDSLVALTAIRQVTCHGHADRGSFVFEYGGESLILDPGMIGYSDPASRQYQETFCHSTPTFSGRSQSAGTEEYDTRVLDFYSSSGDLCPGDSAGIDWAIFDIGAVYPEARRLVRQLLFARSRVVCLIDEVETFAEEPFELNFTCLGPIEIEAADGPSHLARAVSDTGDNRLDLVTCAAVPLADSTARWGTHWPEVPSYRLIRSAAGRITHARMLTVLVATGQGDSPARIRAEARAGCIGLDIDLGDERLVVGMRTDEVPGDFNTDGAGRESPAAGRTPGRPGAGIDTDAGAFLVRMRGDTVSAAICGGTSLSCNGVPVVLKTPDSAGGGIAGGLTAAGGDVPGW